MSLTMGNVAVLLGSKLFTKTFLIVQCHLIIVIVKILEDF